MHLVYVVITNQSLILHFRKENRHFYLVNYLLAVGLFLDPSNNHVWSEFSNYHRVIQEKCPFLLVFLSHLLRWPTDKLVRPDFTYHLDCPHHPIQLLIVQSVVGGQQCTCFEHSWADCACRHICCNKSPERPTAQEQRRLLWVNIKFPQHFENQQPLVIIDGLIIFYGGCLSLWVAETSLVYSVNVEASLS